MFKIKWIKEFLSQQNSMWFHISRRLFNKLGGLEFLLRCDFEVNKIPLRMSNFHKQILHFWKMIFTHNFTPHRSTHWNNRVILINKKSLFKRNWFEKGILFVTDILDRSCNFLSFESFKEKYDVACTTREFDKSVKPFLFPFYN